jgi:copper(I)-binding protein
MLYTSHISNITYKKKRTHMKKNILMITAIPLIVSSILTAQASGQTAASGNTTGSNTTPTQPSATTTQEVVKEITITDSWARKSMSSNNNSAAYMKVTNPTDKNVVIIGASASAIANNVELHKSFIDEKGISRMTSIDKIVVPANTTIELAPGGTHIMLLDLKKSLNTEDKFDLEIKIEGMKPLTVKTEVR